MAITLVSTTQKLQAMFATTPGSDIPCVVFFNIHTHNPSDVNPDNRLTPAIADAATDILEAPPADTEYNVRNIQGTNSDVSDNEITFIINDNGTQYPFITFAVLAGYNWGYDDDGWYVIDLNGARLGVGPTGATGPQGLTGPQGAKGDTGATGAQGTAAPTAHSGLTGLTTGDGHTQYIFNAPTSSTRNVITPTGAFKALTLKGATDGTTVLEIQDTAGTAKFTIDENGNVVIKGTLTMDTTAISAVAAPSAGGDAVNKTYADSLSPLTTKGDLLGFSTLRARVPVGANDQVLTADSTDAEGVTYKDPPIPVGLFYQSSSAIAGGSVAAGISGSGSNAARFVVPAGKTFKVAGVSGHVDTGAIAGTHTLRFITDVNSSYTTLAEVITTTLSTIFTLDAVGTIASPLASFAAGTTIKVGFQNASAAPNIMGTNNKSVFVVGYLV